MNDFLEMINEDDEKEDLEILTQLSKEFEEKGFDQSQLLKDIASQINDSEIPYQFPAVQRAWVAGKLLTSKLQSRFTRESAYEILNYLRTFKLGNKAWNPDEGYHQKTKTGTYCHTLLAWKVIDDAATKANVFTTFASTNNTSQDEILSEFVEDNSEYVSYIYYVAQQWGLPVFSPIFDDGWASLEELVEALREICVNHNFHDVVEVIDQQF